ncbi:MAG: helix-turn-helix transcriptional regulator [Phycisphaerae bacterium]|nr:helix-turn-helix transcriptional regulator [Phycisphaerae bacterium]
MTEITRNWWGWWRPSESPSVPVPLGARSVGQANFNSGWKHNTGIIHWVNIYWGLQGQVQFLADGVLLSVLADHFVVLPPETHITGVPVPQAGNYRWLTLDGPMAWELICTLNLDKPPLRWAGKCPVELFDQLENEIQGFMYGSEYHASTIAYEILVQAAQATPQHDDKSLNNIVKQARDLLEQQYTDPQCNVNKLAGQLKTHRSQLSRLFRKAAGMSPSEYLQRLRLRKALSLLHHSDMSISEIAFACGYSDPAYFSRRITQEMGRCPNEFRKSL